MSMHPVTPSSLFVFLCITLFIFSCNQPSQIEESTRIIASDRIQEITDSILVQMSELRGIPISNNVTTYLDTNTEYINSLADVFYGQSISLLNQIGILLKDDSPRSNIYKPLYFFKQKG